MKTIKEKYFDYLERPIKVSEGVFRPLIKKPIRWRNFISRKENDTFINLENILNNEDINVWIWSDHHFYHDKVIGYSKRPFNSGEEMNETFINNYNEVVKEGDICLFLGDVTFGGVTKFKEDILPRISKGYNIQILGNHDFQNKNLKYLGMDETHSFYSILYKNKNVITFSHFPFDEEYEDTYNIHGHTHEKDSLYPFQRNVSVEKTDYKPINLRKLINEMVN